MLEVYFDILITALILCGNRHVDKMGPFSIVQDIDCRAQTRGVDLSTQQSQPNQNFSRFDTLTILKHLTTFHYFERLLLISIFGKIINFPMINALNLSWLASSNFNGNSFPC